MVECRRARCVFDERAVVRSGGRKERCGREKEEGEEESRWQVAGVVSVQGFVSGGTL